MLWRGGSRNTYAADGSGLLREEVPEAERGTPTTTRGGRVGTLELEIGLTTNRERELEPAKCHAGAKGGGEGKIWNANRISANQSPRCVN